MWVSSCDPAPIIAGGDQSLGAEESGEMFISV